jgi:hypothetical protein
MAGFFYALSSRAVVRDDQKNLHDLTAWLNEPSLRCFGLPVNLSGTISCPETTIISFLRTARNSPCDRGGQICKKLNYIRRV